MDPVMVLKYTEETQEFYKVTLTDGWSFSQILMLPYSDIKEYL